MKKYYSLLAILWGWIAIPIAGSAQQWGSPGVHTWQSPNVKAGTATSYNDMLRLDYHSIFEMHADLKGGVIGTVNSGGEIRLKVYAYNDEKTDGKGALVYGVYIDQSATSYSSGKTWHEEAHWYSTTVYSSDIKKLTRKADIFIPNAKSACKHYMASFGNAVAGLYNVVWTGLTFGFGETDPLQCAEFNTPYQPVIVEVTVNNATVQKLKVPGLAEFEAGEIFGSNRPIAPINGKITLGSHRGNWQDVTASENTKNSISDMLAEQYDMVELDLLTTIDDSVIVFHDMGLNKRTVLTGGVQEKTWQQLSSLYVKNRFDELIQSPETKIELLETMLNFIKTNDPAGNTWINLDRSANDMKTFKEVYKIVARTGMLDRVIFKGRYNPKPDEPNGPVSPTPTSILQAFREMFPGLSDAQLHNKMKLMHYTPVLFDNKKDEFNTNDNAFAEKIKTYIDQMIQAGLADGFELNYKSYPVGSPAFANASDDHVFLLKQWPVLQNGATARNFIEYVHANNLPVGIFASVPEVCAIPDFNADGSRDVSRLVSGFVKEDYNQNFKPRVTQQGTFDFRGDWEFYIPAGADFVITDRPDALRAFLLAIGRYH